MKKFLSRIHSLIVTIWRINLFATIIFNLRTLPFSQALHFPVFCFGPIKFHSLSGSVIIPNNKLRMGMVKIGYRWCDLWPMSYLPTQILINGQLIFRGPSMVSGGVYIGSFRHDTILEIGSSTLIGGGSMVKAVKKIVIGDHTRITGNVTVFDSNMHFVKNIINGHIGSRDGEIIIGKNCWINSGSIVSKGSVLPSYSILARNTFISKDYSEEGENLFIAGSPGKVIKKGVQRIFNINKEREISEFFKLNPDKEIFASYIGIENE